jgi:CBS domain containing-hemolysin-like protein
VSRTAIESRAGKGDPMARRVLAVLTSPDEQDRFIATAQFGITVASLGLGMYAEHAVAAWLQPRLELPAIARLITAHSLASILAVSALTYVHILFGETIPEAIALAAAERTAKVLYWPMRGVTLLFYPFVWLLSGTGEWRVAAASHPQHRVERSGLQPRGANHRGRERAWRRVAGRVRPVAAGTPGSAT